jgi:hypothetical protein
MARMLHSISFFSIFIWFFHRFYTLGATYNSPPRTKSVISCSLWEQLNDLSLWGDLLVVNV